VYYLVSLFLTSSNLELNKVNRMGKTYLVNAFSINMIREFPATVRVDMIDGEEFCETLGTQSGELINAVGHDSTIDVINKLCGTQLQKNRIEIKMVQGDIAFAIMVNHRLEEGKVLNEEEILRMLWQGKISFYKVILE